jgi:hypothetical protein
MVLLILQFDSKDVFPNKKKARIAVFIIDKTWIQIGDADACFGLQSNQFIMESLIFIFQSIEIC